MSFLTTNDFWKPRTYYRSQPRYKNIVMYENRLFICNTSHVSGLTFDENLDKFTPVAAGGVGGGLSGTWDMTPIGQTTIAVNDVVGGAVDGSLPYTITPNGTDTILIASTDMTYQIGDDIVFYNSYNQSAPYLIYFGFVNADVDYQDIANVISTLPAPSLTKMLIASIFSDNVINGFNPIESIYVSITDGVQHPTNQRISFKLIETETHYTLLVKVESESTYNTILSTTKETLLKPIIFGVNTNMVSTPLIIDSFGGTSGTVQPPSSPIGKRYLVTVGGEYNNQTANSGSIVEFLTLTDIFVVEDVNNINDGISSIVSSLQTQITNIRKQSLLTPQIIDVPISNVTNNLTYNYNFHTNNTSDFVLFNYDYNLTSDSVYITLNQRTGPTHECIIGVYFNKDSTINLVAGTNKLGIEVFLYGVTGDNNEVGATAIKTYYIDIAQTRLLLFRYTNGLLTPIGRRVWDDGNSVNAVGFFEAISTSTQETFYCSDTESINYPLRHSNTNKILLIPTEQINVMSIIINGSFVNMFDDTLEKGIILILDATTVTVSNFVIYYRNINGDLVNIHTINTTQNRFYKYIYYPKTNTLIEATGNGLTY